MMPLHVASAMGTTLVSLLAQVRFQSKELSRKFLHLGPGFAA